MPIEIDLPPRESTVFPVPHLGVGNGEHAPDPVFEPRLFLDVKSFLDGKQPEPPVRVAGIRTDGEALFYAGQVNVVFGDPEGGKTLLALAASVKALEQGRRVAILDLDHNGPAATLNRLQTLGASLDALTDQERFCYVEPEDAAHLVAVVRSLRVWNAAVVVVDSIGELLPLLRLSSNSPDDFTTAHTTVLKPLAMAGAAVIAIDHLAKNTDSRAAGPTGTSAKKRAVGGVSLRVKVTEQFTPGRGGRAKITINKDRHGGLRAACPTAEAGSEAEAGTFVLTETPAGTTWRIYAPDGTPGDGRTNQDVDALSALDPPPSSVRDVKARMEWGTSRSAAAWRLFSERSPFPTPIPGTGNTCTECAEPMVDVGDGATIHPTCEVTR